MLVHAYHFELMHSLIKVKLKGDHRQKLTVLDRKSLVNGTTVTVSKDYMVRILTEGKCRPKKLSQYVLNQLVSIINYPDWNAFLRANPVPANEYMKLFKPISKKRLAAVVEKRLQELKNQQP